MEHPEPLDYARRENIADTAPRVVFEIVRWSIYLTLFLGLDLLVVVLLFRSRRTMSPLFLFMPLMFTLLVMLCVLQILQAWRRHRKHFDK